jgi:hypothetical protein
MEGNPLTQVDPGLAIWTILVFVGLLVALKYLAWKAPPSSWTGLASS